MNILQSFSLIPICLGAALPLNSNDQSSTQSNLPTYETNIQYQYETNDVNSFDDIKVGNVYKIKLFYDDEYIWLYTLSGNFVSTSNFAYDNVHTGYLIDVGYVDDITNEEWCAFEYYNDGTDKILISILVNMYSENPKQQIDIYYVLDFHTNPQGFYDFISPLVIYCLMEQNLYNNLANDDYLVNFISRCPAEYIPYILVEPQVSDNIYVNLYEFYYDLFQNEGINSVTFEIGSQNISLSSWIAHSLTIITLIVLVVITILFVIWLFKFLSGFILLRQS